MPARFCSSKTILLCSCALSVALGADAPPGAVVRRRIPPTAIVEVTPRAPDVSAAMTTVALPPVAAAGGTTATAPARDDAAATRARRMATVKFDPRTLGPATNPVIVSGGQETPTRTDTDGKISVEVEAGRLTYVKPDAATPPAQLEADEFLLNSRVLVPITKPGTDEIETVVECVPYVRPNPAVVSWDETGKRYVTTAQVGLRSTSETRSSFALPEPVSVSLEFIGIESPDAQTEPPGLVHLKAVGIEGEARVRLTFVAAGARPRLNVRADFGEQLAELELVPTLRVQPQRQEVPGLGLGDATLVVRRAFRGRTREFELDPRTLSAPIFTLADGDLKLPNALSGDTGIFTVRSSGLGAAHIEVSADGESVLVEVTQKFPWLPVAFALAGGAMGGFSRRFRRTRATPARIDGRRVWEGTIVGFVVFVGAAFGVRFIPQLPTEIVGSALGAFITAFAGGLCGVMVLEGLRPSRDTDGKATPARTGD